MLQVIALCLTAIGFANAIHIPTATAGNKPNLVKKMPNLNGRDHSNAKSTKNSKMNDSNLKTEARFIRYKDWNYTPPENPKTIPKIMYRTSKYNFDSIPKAYMIRIKESLDIKNLNLKIIFTMIKAIF